MVRKFNISIWFIFLIFQLSEANFLLAASTNCIKIFKLNEKKITISASHNQLFPVAKLNSFKLSDTTSFKADPEQLIKLLRNIHSFDKPWDILFTELTQNATDAINQENGFLTEKDNLAKSPKFSIKTFFQKTAPSVTQSPYQGEVRLIIDRNNRKIVMVDNGSGMDLETLKKGFLTLGGSFKNENSAGGYGIAKAFIIGLSENFTISTAKDGIIHEFTAESSQILENPNYKIPIKSRKDSEVKNGTMISITLSKSVDDIPEWDHEISFFDNPYLGKTVDFKYMTTDELDLIVPSLKVIRDYVSLRENNLKEFFNKNPNDSKEFYHFEYDYQYGKIQVSIAKEESSYGSFTQVLSNGLFYFKTLLELDSGDRVKRKIILSFTPSVGSKDPNYPFDITRRNFRPSMEIHLNELKSFLRKKINRIEYDEYLSKYKNMVELPKVDIKSILENALILKTKKVIYFDDPENQRFFESDDNNKLSMDLNRIELTNSLLMNNTDINLEDLKYTDTFIFFSKLTSVMDLIQTHLITAENNKSLNFFYKKNIPLNIFKNFQSGIILDKRLGGVNIKATNLQSFFFLNPFQTFIGADIESIVEDLYVTIIHELTHCLVTPHNENFTITQHEILIYLAQNNMNAVYKNAIEQILLQHKDTFIELRKRFRNSKELNHESTTP